MFQGYVGKFLEWASAWDEHFPKLFIKVRVGVHWAPDTFATCILKWHDHPPCSYMSVTGKSHHYFCFWEIFWEMLVTVRLSNWSTGRGHRKLASPRSLLLHDHLPPENAARKGLCLLFWCRISWETELKNVGEKGGMFWWWKLGCVCHFLTCMDSDWCVPVFGKESRGPP